VSLSDSKPPEAAFVPFLHFAVAVGESPTFAVPVAELVFSFVPATARAAVTRAASAALDARIARRRPSVGTQPS
jgi:hypothetical protein